jgi:S-adenosylmethionine-dependent methyltransferase
MMTGKADTERFQGGAGKYADYLDTPEGRLRADLTFANLQEFLAAHTRSSLRALDIGGGTGATAIRLAQLGIHVTVLDSSAAMLEIARRAADNAKVTAEIAMQQGDAAQLAELLPGQSFDVILCHNVLEFCDDPGAVLCAAARTLRDPSSIVSVLVRNQAGEVLKAALVAGDLVAAQNGLTAEWGQESLYGGKLRLFMPARLRAMLAEASLAPMAERGVRVLADYLPPQISRTAAYQRIFELERQLGSRADFAAVARYTHTLARRLNPVAKVAQ